MVVLIGEPVSEPVWLDQMFMARWLPHPRQSLGLSDLLWVDGGRDENCKVFSKFIDTFLLIKTSYFKKSLTESISYLFTSNAPLLADGQQLR